MSIKNNYENVKKAFNTKKWDTIKDFEMYFLRRLSESTSDRVYYTDEYNRETYIDAVDNHPILKEYEVWSEGYAATGEDGGAYLVGKVYARNFAQACHIVMCKDYIKHVDIENKSSNNDYCTPSRWDYNPNELSCWGCSLYWSEELARKNFG